MKRICGAFFSVVLILMVLFLAGMRPVSGASGAQSFFLSCFEECNSCLKDILSGMKKARAEVKPDKLSLSQVLDLQVKENRCELKGFCPRAFSRVQTDNRFDYEAELLDLVNAFRVQNRLEKLTLEGRFIKIAKGHSQYQNASRKLTHENFNDRFKRSGRLTCVENCGAKYDSPLGQFEGWKNSSEHKRNMLNKKIRTVGLARVGDYVTFFACD